MELEFISEYDYSVYSSPWDQVPAIEQAFQSKGGKGGVSPPKLSVDVPFFADEPFKCALFERSNQKCTSKSTREIMSKLK